ncbi:MAG: restriction endonuclease subunit S [Thermodesulfobacteriota bacterium]
MEHYIENNLPEGWVEITLDQILQTLESGSRPKGGVKGIEGGVLSIGGEHINENGGFKFEKIKYVTYNFFKQMKHGHIQIGDILIVKDGATTGKVALVREDFPYNPAAVNEHVFICRLEKGVHPPFLFYFLFSKEGQDRILENFRGSAQGGINQSFAPGTMVPLAPLAEQNRIVEKVEELLARINTTRERLARVSMILKRFRQAVLAAACSGRLTADWRNKNVRFESGKESLLRICGKKALVEVPSDEDPVELSKIPEEWIWSRCQYLCEPERIITYGVIKLGPAIKNGVWTLRSSDVRWLYIDKDHIKRISPEIAAKYYRTFLKGGEILITVRGSLGGVAVVPKEMAGYNISREVAMLPLHPEFDSKFFSYAIASTWSQNWLSEVTKGVAYTGVNIRDLKRLPLPVPTIAEQHEIVCRVEAMFKLADAVEKRVTAATVRAEKLTKAILAKAFRGELVPTEAELARREGRCYESASELLARIKSKRHSKEIPGRPHRDKGRQKVIVNVNQ